MKRILNRRVLTYILSALILLTGLSASYYLYTAKASGPNDGMYVEVNSTYIKPEYTIPPDLGRWEDIPEGEDKCFWSYPGILFKTNFTGSVIYYADDKFDSNKFTDPEFTEHEYTFFFANTDTTLKVLNKKTGAIRYSDLADHVYYIHAKFTRTEGGDSFIRTYPIFTSKLYDTKDLVNSWPFGNPDPILRSNDEQTITFKPQPSKTVSNYPSYNRGYEIYSTADKDGKVTDGMEVGDIWNKYQAALKHKSEVSTKAQIQVLNVYPDVTEAEKLEEAKWYQGQTLGPDQLAGWMSTDGAFSKFGVDKNGNLGKLDNLTGFGRGLITVKPMTISEFNGGGFNNLSEYEVIAFGSWDRNNDKDITKDAYDKVVDWMKDPKHNIIFGHDTCINQSVSGGYKHTNLTNLAVKYLGLEQNTTTIAEVRATFSDMMILNTATIADYSPWFNGHITDKEDSSILYKQQDPSWYGLDRASYHNSLYNDAGYGFGDKGSHVTQTAEAEKSDNSFLKYPWNIYMDNTGNGINYLDVPICHTTGQQFTFGAKVKSYLAFYNNDYTRIVRSKTNEHATWDSVKDKKNLAYLTVNDAKSAALIQTGHSSGKAIDQEKQIWANLIFALCEKSEDTNTVSAPVVDANGPVISSGVYNSETKSIDLKTNDCETKNYFTINTTDTSGYNFALSKLIDYGWASGVKGYKYFFSSDYYTTDDEVKDLTTFNKKADHIDAEIHNYEIPLDKVQAGAFSINNSIDLSMSLDKKRYCYIIPYDYSKRTNTDNPNEETKEPNYGNVIRVEINDSSSIITNPNILGGDFLSDEGDHKVVWNKAGSNKPVIITGSAKAKTGVVYNLGISLSNAKTPPTTSDDGVPIFDTTEFARYFNPEGSRFDFMKDPSSWINKLDCTDEGSLYNNYLFKSINMFVSSSNKKEGIEMVVYTVGSTEKDSYSALVPSKDSYIQDNTPPEIRASYSNGVGKIESVIDSYNGNKTLASGIKKISYCMKDRSSGSYGSEVVVFTGVDLTRNNQVDNLNIPEAAHPDKYSGIKIISLDNVGNQSEKEIPIAYVEPQEPIDEQSSGDIILSNYKYCSKGSADKWVNKKDNFNVTFNSNLGPTCAKTLAQGMLGGYYDTIDSFSDETMRSIVLRFGGLGMLSYSVGFDRSINDMNDSSLTKNFSSNTYNFGLVGNTFNAMLNVTYNFNAKNSNEGIYPITGSGLATNKATAKVSGFEPYLVYHSMEMGLDENKNMVVTKDAWTETKYKAVSRSDYKIYGISKDYTCPSKLCVDGTKPVFECLKIGRYEASFNIKDTGSGINQILIKGARSKSEAEAKGGTILVKQSTRGSTPPTAVESTYEIVKEIHSSDADSNYPTLQLYSNKDDKKNSSYPFIYYEITDNVGNVTEGTVGPLVTVTEGKITVDGKDSEDYSEIPFNYNTTYPHGPNDIPEDAKLPSLQKEKNLVAVPSTVKKYGKDRKVLDVIGDLTITYPVPEFNPIIRLETKGRESEINTINFEKAPALIEQTIPAIANKSIFKKEIYIDDSYNTPVKPITKEIRDATYSYLEWEKMTDPKLPYFFTIYSKVSNREDFINEIDTRFPIFFASGYHHDKVQVYNVSGEYQNPNFMQKANPKIDKEVVVAEGKLKGLVDTSFLRSGWYKAEITMYDFNGNPSGMTEYWFYHDQPALYTPYKVAITAVKDVDWENLDSKKLDYGETYYRPVDEEGKEVTLDIVNGSDQSKFPLGKVWGAKGNSLKRISDGGNPIAKGYAVNWEFCKENNTELKSLVLRYTFKNSSGGSLKIMQNGSTIAKDFTDKDGSKSYFTEQALTAEQLNVLNQPTLIVGHYQGSPLASHYNSTVSIKHFLPVNFVAYDSSTNQLYSGPVTVSVKFDSTAVDSSSTIKNGIIQSIDLYTIDQMSDALDDMKTDKQR